MDVNRRGIVCVIGFVVVVLQLGVLASANMVLHVQHNLYFTKIQIGSPPKDYHVQVDTGSDLLWVNCIECESCPKTSDLGVPLQLYDPNDSSSAKKVTCDDDFCRTTMDSSNTECKVGMSCLYTVTYGDGSGTAGYFINDNLQLLKASGDGETKYMSGNITFGCGAKQSGELGSSEQALDGILGLGQTGTSLLSQFASAKKVKRMFSHCLSGSKGGGIFAIGEVVEPKVKTTPMLEDNLHYNVEMKSIDVNGETLDIPKNILDLGKKEGAIVDSGTTLAYFPAKIYNPLMQKISLTFEVKTKTRLTPENLLLADRLVTYDIENKAIGWVDHDCSSTIKVKDEESGNEFEVHAGDISSARCTSTSRMILGLLLFLAGTLINWTN
ncbi:Aspartic peptidase [Cynara cardunculus var. scolymus]|uniref:Aspartic peptidase n=1 Tax=Cynara cardunculus var. scolymus TaxID=59895 RepID=A0A103YF06_CYNCS|nr:Aspartic peptidase [Cynara cardunculus var. scolymus]